MKAELPALQARAILEVMETEIETDTLSMKEDLAKFSAELKDHVHVSFGKFKYALVRWMFVFWVAQLGAMFALVKALK